MLHSKKNFVLLRVAALILFCCFIITAKAQDDTQLLIKGQTSAHARKKGLGLNGGVKAVDFKDEPLEGVDIEVKKNDVTILKITSGKKGKYSFQIPVSTSDAKNDYVVYVTKDGMVPKMININSYLSKDEFKKYPGPKYDYEMDLPLLLTTVKDIALDKPSAKVKWDNVKEHKFTIDEAYYTKYIRGDEQKMEANTDQYFTALAKKKKKTDDALALKKAAADAAKQKLADEAKKKADEEAQRLADLKAKADAEKAQREKEQLAKLNILKKHISDSIVASERQKALDAAANAKLDIKKVATPAQQGGNGEEEEIKDPFDASGAYSINVARKALSENKRKLNKERGKNLSAKYETFNILTSLLDVVDENDKRGKKQ